MPYFSFAPDSEVLFLQTPAGDIPYLVRWLGKGDDGFGETYAERAGKSTRAVLIVRWDDASDFKRFALGHCDSHQTGPTWFLDRRLPFLCPWTEDQYVDEIDAVGVLGAAAQIYPDPAFDGWPHAEAIAYACTFRDRPYDLKSDAELSEGATERELRRYVIRTRKPIIKERKLNSFQVVKTSDPNSPLSDVVGFLPWSEATLVYTWVMCPVERVPWAAIDATANKINSATFDSNPGSLKVGGPFAAKKLLLSAVDGLDAPYKMPNNKWAFDISYTFRYKPVTWDHVPVSNGTEVQVQIRGSGDPLYQTADFGALFKPE